jgi:hypothetical protein
MEMPQKGQGIIKSNHSEASPTIVFRYAKSYLFPVAMCHEMGAFLLKR